MIVHEMSGFSATECAVVADLYVADCTCDMYKSGLESDVLPFLKKQAKSIFNEIFYEQYWLKW